MKTWNLIGHTRTTLQRFALVLAAGAGLGVGAALQAQQAIPGRIEAESYSAMSGIQFGGSNLDAQQGNAKTNSFAATTSSPPITSWFSHSVAED
jgi:hypothetical protein